MYIGRTTTTTTSVYDYVYYITIYDYHTYCRYVTITMPTLARLLVYPLQATSRHVHRESHSQTFKWIACGADDPFNNTHHVI